MEQLVRDGRLQQFLYRPNRQGDQAGLRAQGNASSRPPLGKINVIFATLRRINSRPSGVMSIAQLPAENSNLKPKRARVEVRPTLSFSNENKVRTIQRHDNALVVTLRIGGYNVKRVLVDQGSGIEIICLDLYKGLNLKPKDLTADDSPLVSFDGKVVIPKDLIRLSVQAGSDVVEVDFIVVDAYSPYTATVARPWLHALGGYFFHPAFQG